MCFTYASVILVLLKTPAVMVIAALEAPLDPKHDTSLTLAEVPRHRQRKSMFKKTAST